MTGKQLCLRILLLTLTTVLANASDVSHYLPQEIYPVRSGRQSPGPQSLKPDVESKQPHEDQDTAAVNQELEHDIDENTIQPPEEENPINDEVPETTESNVDDIQKILDEKEELLKRIKMLEEANRNLKLASRRTIPSLRNDTTEPDLIIDTLTNNLEKGIVTTRPVDCADHLVLGATRSGVYEIYPFTCLCSKPIRVYCDMETDGGGWTVLMTRDSYGQYVNFNRSWTDYKVGFGDASSEYWLGNEHLHIMTSSREYALRMDIHTSTGDFKSALWKTFTVDTETNRYKLIIGAYSPESTTYTNCLLNVGGRFFTTFDRDYDGTTGNCAVTYGGFWHYYCSNVVHPTGDHGKGLISTCFNEQRIAASFMQFKIRPVVCGSTFKTVYLNSYDCDSCH